MCVYSDVHCPIVRRISTLHLQFFVSFMFFVSLQVEGPSDPHLLVYKYKYLLLFSFHLFCFVFLLLFCLLLFFR